jgi:hypothetical protein
VQQIAWTLSCRIISASDRPSSAVLIAPARVTSILPPASRWAIHAIGRVNERRGVEVAIVRIEKVTDVHTRSCG